MSEKDEKTIRILQFSSKDEDRRMWSAKFMAKAKLKGFYEILKGTKKAPNDSVAKDNEENKKLANMNDKAYNELVLSCVDETSSSIVDGAKTSELAKGDVKLAWNELKLRFEPETGTELVRLKREYNGLQMKANEDPDDYLTRLDNYRNKMKRAPFHHIIRDQDFFIHVLNTLPKEYKSVVEALERKLGKGTLTMTKVKSKLRSKYARVKMGKKANKNDMVLFTR